MASHGLTPQEARDVLTSVSEKTEVELYSVAEQITLGTYRSPADPSLRAAVVASVEAVKSKRPRPAS